MPEASAAEPWHGTPGGYGNRKCREDCCRKAHTRKQAKDREARRLRGLADPSLVPHGTEGGYGNWGCREPCCREAHAIARQEYREKKKKCGG